jgi:ATP-binding cassette subfamily B protein
VLQDIDLTLPVGKTTAVVGASGAGKSSLVNLLTRLYDPTAGSILIDGIDLRRVQVRSWRRKVAVVSQEVFLFHASVWDNLRFARPTATEAEIVSACQMAQIHDFILSLPEGYATMLQERGQRLSGGQRQRIALARALLVEGADLLVFDEATSELDAPTEEAVYRALARSASASTRLIIAHRLSVVRNADWIVVLEKGRVKEQGTHDQLLASGGAYARLARVQDPSPAVPSRGNTPGH